MVAQLKLLAMFCASLLFVVGLALIVAPGKQPVEGGKMESVDISSVNSREINRARFFFGR